MYFRRAKLMGYVSLAQMLFYIICIENNFENNSYFLESYSYFLQFLRKEEYWLIFFWKIFHCFNFYVLLEALVLFILQERQRLNVEKELDVDYFVVYVKKSCWGVQFIFVLLSLSPLSEIFFCETLGDLL